MRQVVQSVSDGSIEVIETPVPRLKPGHVLVKSLYSAVSPGTERSLIEFGKSSLVAKARQRPDAVAEVFEKARKDGFLSTFRSVRGRLQELLPLGYSNVGIVVSIGKGVSGLSVGDRVVSNGPHADFVLVPQTLCAKVPDSVEDEEAAFSVLGAVALQGVRNASPQLGECFVVVGLGAIGLLTCQILLASGSEVIGVETNPGRASIARDLGIVVTSASDEKSILNFVHKHSLESGVDGVILATSSSGQSLISMAAKLCRVKGRIVLVGTTDMDVSRRDFYEKELSFVVSSSYGPGRYDPKYEGGLLDYPLPYVRWTAGRNFDAVLGLFARRRIQTASFSSPVFSIADAPKAYQNILTQPDVLTVLLRYQHEAEHRVELSKRVDLIRSAPAPVRKSTNSRMVRLGVVGSGNYAKTVLVPALSGLEVELVGIASEGGLSATGLARKHGFRFSSSDASELISGGEIDAVLIATRHDSHSALAVEAIEAGIGLFVEKPLASNLRDLKLVESALSRKRLDGIEVPFTVGFNRRFAPLTRRLMAEFRDHGGPYFVSVHVNGGKLPRGHWLLDPSKGGGRVIGEGIHFLDIARFIVGSKVSEAGIRFMASKVSDSFIVDMGFEDGSIASITYSADDSPKLPKETIRVSSAGRTAEVANFRKFRVFDGAAPRFAMPSAQDKGHQALLKEFINSCQTGNGYPIPLDEIFEINELAITLAEK